MKIIYGICILFLIAFACYADDQEVYDNLVEALHAGDSPAFQEVPKYNINFKSSNESSILLMAGDKESSEFVKLLIVKGADVNLASGYSNWTVLMAAAQAGRMETVQFLLTKGAKINALSSNKENALHFVCNNGNLEMAKMLLAAKINVNQSDEDRITPLHLAYWSKGFRQSDMQLVTLLLKAGADSKARNNDKELPLDYEAKGKNKAADKSAGGR
jgi:ankyrin repeat protein